MKKQLITLIIILASIALTAGIVKAASTYNITSRLGGASGGNFDLDGTLMVDSLKVGSQGIGGVTYFNGTIINNTTGTGNSNNPVTFGDNVRIDGYVYRGPTAGTGDSKPFTVNDDVQINGTLTVGSTNIINAINSISDHDTLGSLSCSSGQIPKRGTSGWACASDIDTDADTFADLNCAWGESPWYSGVSWDCQRLLLYPSSSSPTFIEGGLQLDLPSNGDAIDLYRDVSVENYLRLDDLNTPYSQPATSCNSGTNGRMIMDSYTNKLWICMSGGWKSFTAD